MTTSRVCGSNHALLVGMTVGPDCVDWELWLKEPSNVAESKLLNDVKLNVIQKRD